MRASIAVVIEGSMTNDGSDSTMYENTRSAFVWVPETVNVSVRCVCVRKARVEGKKVSGQVHWFFVSFGLLGPAEDGPRRALERGNARVHRLGGMHSEEVQG